jgi:hypothetical protein
MRTGFRIDALVREAKPFHWTPADQVLLHNFGRICRLHVPIPNRLRVNDDCGPMLALIEAARLVDPHNIS